ncbi:MAG: O-methyltransferase [Clostridia bacterium]|nr:O-methyltransferase [Clostridia bacterium]
MKYTSSLVKLNVDERLKKAREDALSRGVPVCEDETLQLLLLTVQMSKAERVLEIGTAVGLSASALLLSNEKMRVTTIELEEERYLEAKENFEKFGVADRVAAYLGDAGEIRAMMSGEFDFVFMDGPKAQYEKYLFDVKRLLKQGGVIFADDVLLFGWVDGKEETPQKRRSIVEKIRSYLDVVTSDKQLLTSVLDVGDGVALSILQEKNQ